MRLVIPTDKRAVDYAEMVNRVVNAVARLYDRDAQDIFAQVYRPCDYLSVRVSSESTRDGSLPLFQAERLVHNLRELTEYAACAELAPKPHYRRKLKAAGKLAEECFLGQSRIGSYVAAMYVPIPLEPEPQRQRILFDQDVDVPIERRMVERIFRGLSSAEGASATRSVEPIMSDATLGLNANMCDTLAELIDAFADSVLTFSGGFDHGLRTDFVPGTPRLDSGSSELLRAASSRLRGEEDFGEAEIEGYIYQLRNEHGQEDRVARIEWRRGRDVFKVRAFLESDDYTSACEAHKRGQRVRLRGYLERMGRGWKLQNARDLQAIPESDEERA